MTASKRLKLSVRTLFIIGFAGQIFFAIYILLFFGGSAFDGNWQQWTDNLIHGFERGDLIGNFALFTHIMLAFIITLGGPLQFVKSFRERGRKFHKWNGRIYISTALLISLGALYMVWSKEATVGAPFGRLGNTLNAILIIAFSILTLQTALKGNFEAHRKWAIRTFIVVSGVWFFRIGYGTWFLVTNFKAYGMANDLSGPFDQFLYFGSYLVPLAITESYLYVKDNGSGLSKNILAFIFLVLSLLLIGGTAITTKVFWIDSIFA